MLALLESRSTWGGVIALVGFATGYGTDAAARREGDAGVGAAVSSLAGSSIAGSPVSRGPAPGIGGTGIGGTGIGGMGIGGMGERADVPYEALAAALSSGAGLGGEISRPLPAL
jgi:hypothetical protein